MKQAYFAKTHRWCWALILCTLAWLSLPRPVQASQASRPAAQSPQVAARLALASAYFDAAQYAVALEETEIALLAAPLDVQALGLKALLLHRMQEPALAEATFLQASALAPHDAALSHNLGVFYCEQQRFEQAYDRFATALQQTLYQDKAKTNWVWGLCLSQNQLWPSAAMNMELALNLKPSWVLDSLPLAQAQLKLGRAGEAEKTLRAINASQSISAQSLWMAIQLAQAGQQSDQVSQWGKMLGLQFPMSPQWSAYQREAFHE